MKILEESGVLLRKAMTRIWKEAKGEVTVEYGLIIAIIAIICIGILLFINGSGGNNPGSPADSLKNSGF